MIQIKSNLGYEKFESSLSAETRGKSIPPWLSIVIPAYNVENYICPCVASIDPAAHSDIQVILVDDGSTDSTSAICDQLANSNDNVISIHKENGGSASARNSGFEKACGIWTWFVDADDLIAPSALGILKTVVDNSDSDAIQIGFVLFSDGEKPVWPALIPSEKLETVSPKQFLSGIYHGCFQHFMCSFLLRTDAVRNSSVRNRKECDSVSNRRDQWGFPFREDFSLYEDVVAIEGLIRQFKCVDVINLPVYGYRQVATSITQQRSNKAAESGLRAVREIAHYKTSPVDVDAKACMEVSLLVSAYKLTKGDNSKPLRHAIEKEIDLRVKRVGILRLGLPRVLRYVLLKTRLLNVLIRVRDRT